MKIIITFPERGEIKKELNGLTLNLLAHIQGDVKINFPYRVTCGFCASSATRLVRARERELAPQWNGLALVWSPSKCQGDVDGMVGALEPDMEIKVQIIWEGRTITLKFNSKDTLATVKSRIHNKEGRSSSMATEKARMQQYHPDQQLIMFPHYQWSPMEPRDGRQFNRRTLSDFNILKESTILLSVAGFIEVILHTGEIIKVDKV